MESNDKTYIGNIVDFEENIIVNNIMYEIVNIKGLLYAKEIYTGCLFPMGIEVYENVELYPSILLKHPVKIDYSPNSNIAKSTYAIEKYKKDLKNNPDKEHEIRCCRKYVHFIEEPTNDINKNNRININDEIFEDYIVSESGRYKSNFKVLYKLIKLGAYIYAQEIKTNLIFPIYINGFNSIEVDSTNYNDDNNRYINFRSKVWSLGDNLYVDNIPSNNVVNSSIKIDNYLQEFNHTEELTELRNMNIYTHPTLNGLIKKSKKEQIYQKYKNYITSKYEDTFSLRNIPMECTVVNERELQTIVGRETETKELVKATLIGDESVILIGDAGCGKTALVENLARLINDKNKPYLVNKFIVEVNTCSLISGTRYRGEFEEKLQKVIDFAVKNKGNVILFIDEIHTLYGLGRADESKIDAINILKPYIERKDIQIIGATTKEEYNESITQDKAFSSRFTTIKVNNLPSQIKEEIIVNYIEELEQKYNIKLDDNIQKYNLAVELVKLAERQDIRYKINSIRILKRLIKASFTEAIYNEHDKVLTEDIITCLELTDELLVKEEYLNNIKNKLNIKTNSKILKLKV